MSEDRKFSDLESSTSSILFLIRCSTIIERAGAPGVSAAPAGWPGLAYPLRTRRPRPRLRAMPAASGKRVRLKRDRKAGGPHGGGRPRVLRSDSANPPPRRARGRAGSPAPCRGRPGPFPVARRRIRVVRQPVRLGHKGPLVAPHGVQTLQTTGHPKRPSLATLTTDRRHSPQPGPAPPPARRLVFGIQMWPGAASPRGRPRSGVRLSGQQEEGTRRT